jgi:N6-L-threonylcarbamoyladenine synthase
MLLTILAIETSCDETSAAILRNNEVLSNIVFSQEFHTKYGGIVPELASRAQITAIDRICKQAIEEAKINKDEINLVAATNGPGLIGSLLVGLNFAKTFAISRNIGFLGINHIEAHLYSSFIGEKSVEFPFISLIVSGGHTLLVLVSGYSKYKILGTTQDDAAGEAFDKVAKMLGLGYPGGPIIDKLAKEGSENFHRFPVSQVRENVYDFSFSGIKTSVLYFLKKNYRDYNTEAGRNNLPVNDICASFQKAVVESLVEKTILAAKDFNVNIITVSGGVSANSRLREEFKKSKSEGYKIHFPAAKYSTDNAAMVGYTAYLKAHIENLHPADRVAKEFKESLHKGAFARFDYENF